MYSKKDENKYLCKHDLFWYRADVACTILVASNQILLKLLRGPFNNNVAKMRGRGGQKMSVFVHAQGMKTVHTGWVVGEGQKMAKFCPRSC